MNRSANPDRDRTVSKIHQLWYANNKRADGETENEYIARQQKILYNIDKNLRKGMSEKNVKAELGLGSGRKTKRRKTRSRKSRRYKK